MASSQPNQQVGTGPTREDYQAEIARLRQALEVQTITQGGATPRQKLPQTEPFDGSRKAFPAWRLAIRAKLATDGAALGSDADQFNYIFSRLTGTALQLASPFYEQSVADITVNQTAALFLDYLDTTYLDPNRQARALVALRECQQKPNEPFAAFLPRFEQLLAEAGMVMADANTKLNYLNGALNMALRSATVALVQPADYGVWVQTLQMVGSKVEALPHLLQKSAGRPQYRAPVVHAVAENEMDWEPTPVRANRARGGFRTAWQVKLFDEGRCFHCFAQGHTARDCQNEKGEIPQRFRHLTRQAATGNSVIERPQVRQAKAVWDDEPAHEKSAYEKASQSGQPDFA